MVFVDRLRKMINSTATKGTRSAEGTAKLFAKEVWRLHGNPLDFILTEGLSLQVILLRLCASFFSFRIRQADRRVNRILEDARHFVLLKIRKIGILTLIAFAVNSTWQAFANESPFMLKIGKLSRTSIRI